MSEHGQVKTGKGEGVMARAYTQKNKRKYTAAQFLAAIDGSGGIISAIAQRVGCSWTTAKKYIRTDPIIAEAYESERQKPLDLAESILLTNMKMQADRQKGGAADGELADTSDAKWVLKTMGASRLDPADIDGEQSGASVQINQVIFESQFGLLPPSAKQSFLTALMAAERAMNSIPATTGGGDDDSKEGEWEDGWHDAAIPEDEH